jgi:hypothetical protein
MNIHADKTQENKTLPAPNSLPKQQRRGESAFQFMDNRPEAIQMRKLQEIANNSPRVQQLRAYQEMANNSPQVKQLSIYQATAENFASKTTQRKDNLEEKTLKEKFEPARKNENNTGLSNHLKTGMANLSGRPLDTSPATYNNSNVAQLVIDPNLFMEKLKKDYPRWNFQGPDSMSGLFDAVGKYHDDPSGENLDAIFISKRALKSKYYKRFGSALDWLDYRLESEALAHAPQPEMALDRAPQPEVVEEQEKPLKEYSAKEVYSEFMNNLAEVDSSQSAPKEKQKIKKRLLSEFHHHLKTLPISEIKKFGTHLDLNIREHEKTDTLDKAFGENRAIYRSWHPPGRVSESVNLGEAEEGGTELVGADYLNVALNPARLMNYKTKAKASGLPAIDAVPSSLLYPDQQNTVFNKDRGTATALLPENLYAGFSAYNETVKALLREKFPEEMGHAAEDLKKQAKFMRASITRPVFFNKEDIQSSTGAYNHDDKPDGPHVRKTHSDLNEDHNPLRESLDDKLADPFRANAIFYQTFSQHSKSNSHADEWNEMVVKYRSTGHTAGLHKNIREWVPGLKAHSIIDRLQDSGKFSAEKAKQEAKFVKPIIGDHFDPKKSK